MDYTQFGDQIVELVGGPENIKQLNHCVTRLRFNLVDDTKADAAALKALKGVFGVVNANNQYQVIVGGEVDPTYKAIMNKYDFQAGSIKKETPAAPEKSGFSLKKSFAQMIDYISGTMIQVIPLLIGCGMFNVFLSLGTIAFGLDSASTTYKILYSIGNSVTYFLPIFAAFSAAKNLNCNPFLAAVCVAFLIHPYFTGLIGSETAVTFLSLPVSALKYNGTLFPALLSTWVLSKIEDKVYNFFPAVCRSIFGPFCCIAIVCFLNLFILAPVGYYIGYGIVQIIFAVQNVAGPFSVGIVGALQPLLVMVGAHTLLTPTMLTLLSEVGYDSFLRPAFVASCFSGVGATLAVALKTKKPGFKGVALGSTLTGIMGVGEPSLYGVLLPLKKPFLASLAGGFAGGSVAGLLGCKAYALAKNGIWSLIVFKETTLSICIAVLVALVVSFALTWVMGFDDSEMS